MCLNIIYSMIKPIGDKVLVEALENEEKTSSGIILQKSTEEGTKIGSVVEVGDGKEEDGKIIKANVNKGDKVLFSWGEKIEYEGKEYYLVSSGGLLAIIN